jgi:DeoR/GlpR family transcriptional regulator of sugar metabolism
MKFHTVYDEMTKVTIWEYEGEASSISENVSRCSDEIFKTVLARFQIGVTFMSTKEILESLALTMPSMTEATIRRSIAELVKSNRLEKRKDENARNAFVYSFVESDMKY